MTNKERKIFTLIKKHPEITQKEIAKRLNMTRTSVAVHITHIMEKGYILGRQYVIRKKPLILVIGGSNIDIQGFPTNNFELHNSNIGEINRTYGGVGRTIAVNSNRLVENTKLVTVLSNSKDGMDILEDLKKENVDVSDILFSDKPMSMYLSIFDNKREMVSAISDMELVNELTPEFLMNKDGLFEDAEIIALDTNLPQETLIYAANNKKEDQKIILDTVSAEKAKKITPILDKIDVLKTNKIELEAIMGTPLKNIKSIKSACKTLIDKNVKKIFVTLGENGVIYANSKKIVKISNPKNIKVVDVNGAGDTFTAALIYAELSKFNMEHMTKFAQCAAIYKISKLGPSPKCFSLEKIKETINTYYKDLDIKGEFLNEL
ncbi:carbohydrate kinase [Oceanivirga salmonicida]|uniref:carbohydrate kinase n=1 Tax=Oceanivirga salmonicida TaxID=1769291 RepID=UPI000835D5E7|nr:carbohydrate kinase [Oceanivirga salmonicida]